VIDAPLSGAPLALRFAAALQQLHDPGIDTVVVESPLPGGVSQVVRFLLNTVPSWLQLAGILLGVVFALIVVWFLFKRRQQIAGWATSRTRPVRIALLAAGAVLLLGIAGFGAATWNYTQHSNDFCTGCHVMNPAYERMAFGESEHSRLSCHDCHQQSMFASARQLYLWVAERPEEIGEHAKVPNRICESCHVTGDSATWQRIASTAGHRVHLESDSSALRDLQCVTCHGLEVHRFQPVNRTCGQNGCHDPNDTDIVLGKMAGQTVRHCTNCHEFTVEVPALATVDSARGTLVPGQSQCLGCHEMREMLADFDPRRDPHGGKCGTCHNPHEQERPADAAATCATAGCHGNWQDEPFHMGEHRRVAQQCLVCHAPHAASVDASSCRECHEAVRRQGRLRAPVPFDTSAALRRSQIPHGPPVARTPSREHAQFAALLMIAGPELPVPEKVAWRGGTPQVPPAQQDTFSHARHARLACLTCHETGEGHGRLTFQRPRGCMICHHQAPSRSRCESCHQRSEYTTPQPATVTVAVPGHDPRPRAVQFPHEPHLERRCVECHTTPVTLAPSVPVATCRECHQEHHTGGSGCAVCHAAVEPQRAHPSLEAAHQMCTACHTPTTIAQLLPNRAFCGACHTAQTREHYPGRECSTCHFLADPESHRRTLLTAQPRP
jgi:hypothetical protein